VKIRYVFLLKFPLWLAAASIVLLPVAVQAASMSAQQRQLLNLVNAERARAGLSALQWDDHLAQAARLHTQRMADRRALSHQFRGEPPLPERVGSAGAHFNSVAENIAYAGTVNELHDNLMHSPHHRANILDPKSNAIGIAFVERDGELYVTEDFAHLLVDVSSDQFQSRLIRAFNQFRTSKGFSAMPVRFDQRLEKAACNAKLEPRSILRQLPGATNLTMFTTSQPDNLPSNMQQAAGDGRLRRMSIGVCFKPDQKGGFSTYWVAAAFYPTP
jgi:uncharacterized protein YkwD